MNDEYGFIETKNRLISAKLAMEERHRGERAMLERAIRKVKARRNFDKKADAARFGLEEKQRKEKEQLQQTFKNPPEGHR